MRTAPTTRNHDGGLPAVIEAFSPWAADSIPTLAETTLTDPFSPMRQLLPYAAIPSNSDTCVMDFCPGTS
jgi:hypothetical protein